MMLVRSSRSVAACAARLTASSSASVRALHAQAGVSGSRADVAVCVSLSSPLNSSIVDSSLPSWWPASSIVRTPTSGTTAELPSVYDQRGVDAPEYLYDGEKEAVWCPETDATSEVGEISAMNRNMREPRKANHGARPCSSIRRRRKIKRRTGEHPYIPGRRRKGYDA